MKRLWISVVVVMIAATLAYGQKKPDCPNKERLAKALEGYKDCLKSDNVGVRASALYQLAKLKCCYPALDLSEMIASLDRVSKKDKDALVRVQANLTCAFIADDSLAMKVKVAAGSDPIEFYNQLQTALALRD